LRGFGGKFLGSKAEVKGRGTIGRGKAGERRGG